MKIEILRSTVCGGSRVHTGAVIDDAPDAEARLLIGLGFAVPYTVKPKAKAKRSPVNKMHEPELNRDLGN